MALGSLGATTVSTTIIIGGLQPIPRRDQKDSVDAAMLDDRTFCFVIQHGRHTVVFLDPQGFVANHLNIYYIFLVMDGTFWQLIKRRKQKRLHQPPAKKHLLIS